MVSSQAPRRLGKQAIPQCLKGVGCGVDRLRTRQFTLTATSTTTPAENRTLLQEEIAQANQTHPGRIVIQPSAVYNGEFGLFAQRSFSEGELLFRAYRLKEVSKATTHTIQIGWNRHVVMDLPGRLINHICNQANVGVSGIPHDSHNSNHHDNNTTTKKKNEEEWIYDFVSLRHIEQGDELLCDYETFEYELTQPLECCCGSSTCRGRLRGFRYHGSLVQKTFDKQFIAPYLLTPREASSPS